MDNLKHTLKVQNDFENFLPHTQSIDACLEEPSSISWPYNLVKGIYLNIMPTLPLRGDIMEEDSQQEFKQIGMLQLIRNMLSPRTLPHIIMIAVISSILLFLVSTQEVLVAMSFISLSISYVVSINAI